MPGKTINGRNGRKVDVATALRAFQHVVDRGERTAGGHCYQGIHASTDFDGYTITLSDDRVRLRILFHNRFAIEPTQGKAVEQFLARLARLGKRT